jgi:hypothetical protein
MKISRLGIMFLGVALFGCSTSNLPHGARLVGGGTTIDYKAPTDSTAILVDQTSGKMYVTKYLPEGEDFHFEVDYTTAPVLTNAYFRLYFVPVNENKE